jgi:hypothetical protein
MIGNILLWVEKHIQPNGENSIEGYPGRIAP